jgi:hypothetical protein
MARVRVSGMMPPKMDLISVKIANDTPGVCSATAKNNGILGNQLVPSSSEYGVINVNGSWPNLVNGKSPNAIFTPGGSP